MIEPRLVPLTGWRIFDPAAPLTALERKGLINAGWATLFVIGLWLYFVFGPGTPLVNESASAEAQLTPFIVAWSLLSFCCFLLDGPR